jgi:molybdopterin molybdotransferase
MSESLVTIRRAQELVLAEARPLESELVAIEDALGAVLAEDVLAVGDVPPFDNSAMDGYAVHAGPAGRRLRLVGESRAGAPASEAVEHDSAITISTGAVMPDGAQAVIPVEQTREEEKGWVLLLADVPAGANVRHAGGDQRAGARVLAAGGVLGPAELGAAVTAGRAMVRCTRRPRVAVACSGDEILPPGAPLGPGQIHDSNGVTLSALAGLAGAQVTRSPRIRDDPEETQATLAAALAECDVLIITGGVSVGQHDHVRGALLALGVQERFWRVALRPGKPTWFGVAPPRPGTSTRRLVFGLPGNPVSAMVTFQLFVRPAIAALEGRELPHVQRPAILGTSIEAHPDRDEAVRVTLCQTGDHLTAVPTGRQDSHMLSSMLGADGLLIVPAGGDRLEPGDPVTVELL